MFLHHTDGRMIPFLGPEFVRALLGFDACDGAVEAPLDLDGARPLVTPAKMNAQSDDCRYIPQRITTPKLRQNSSLPDSNRETSWAAANKSPLSASADPDSNACYFLDSGTFLITPADSSQREVLTTLLQGRSVVFSLWDRLVHWFNKHTGATER